jgi:hypothetical protein
MLDMLKRHEIQVLRKAGHSLPDVAELAGVSIRSVQRVEDEAAVASLDSKAERIRRKVGRPSKAEPFRAFVVEQPTKEPDLMSLEILRRARLDGYSGGKSVKKWIRFRVPSMKRRRARGARGRALAAADGSFPTRRTMSDGHMDQRGGSNACAGHARCIICWAAPPG